MVYLNSRHVNISVTAENKKDNRVSFLDVNTIREQGKFTTSVYCKPTVNEIYTHYNSFLSSTYKTGMIHALLYGCFWNCCWNWTKFYLELFKWMEVFRSNIYPENFINNCFKIFLDNKNRIQEKVETLIINLYFQSSLSLPEPCQTRMSKTKFKLGKLSRVFSFVVNYRLYLSVKTN